MPSKVQANMAAGLPIIAAVAGDAAQVVEDADCGRSVAPGDANALASTISELADMNPAAREELGRKSRDYYTSHFSEKAVGDSLEKLLYQHRKRR